MVGNLDISTLRRSSRRPVMLFTSFTRRATVARSGMTPCPGLTHDPVVSPGVVASTDRSDVIRDMVTEFG